MKFYEKLIILRKKSFLSQEALAEKLNVTRQTISKWELEQSKPDMDKLIEISKLFGVNIELLTNDELSIEETKKEIENKKVPKKSNNRRFLLYIFIIIFTVCSVILVYRLANTIKEKNEKRQQEIQEQKDKFKEQQQNISDKIKEQMEQFEKADEEAKKEEEQRKIDSFNHMYEFYQGRKWKTIVFNIIDEVVTNNKKSNEHLIEVIYDNVSYGTDSNYIKTIKDVMPSDNFLDYEISIDYDEIGYVNKVIIERK